MKSENILKVINNFKKVAKLSFFDKLIGKKEGQLDMSVGGVNGAHKCGTIHCHAGWYAVAACNHKESLSYHDGAHKMAKDLGFENDIYLLRWADKYRELWGNPFGEDMFSHKRAFTSDTRQDGAENVQDIVDHWQEVYNRVKTKELLSEPPVDTLIDNAIKKANIPAPKQTRTKELV